MSNTCSVSFTALAAPSSGTAVLLCGEGLELGSVAQGLDKATDGAISKAVKAADFKGKSGSHVDLWTPSGVELDRIVLVGLGKAKDMDEAGWVSLGGAIFKRISSSGGKPVTIVAEAGKKDGGAVEPVPAAQIGLGLVLASYRFDKYKKKKKADNGDKKKQAVKAAIAVADTAAARRAHAPMSKVAEGTLVARDLVNEPANVLGTVEFAREAKKLEKLGVEVEILTEKEMKKLKMHALLGVAQGSVRPPRMAVMVWNGAKAKTARPVVFVGKGVVFDTGGISIKPAGGMEDMKGDMGGAGCVTGLMHALAARKAKVNAIGVIALVENMPDGKAQRPGDIVESMSGQTIEVINTDAEGRLILADALTYVQKQYKPQFIIDLATLTGAIIVALGPHHAGLFSNDDTLSAQLAKAGEATGEKVWRMPLGKEYDKMIDSKNADMKNVGGRHAGSITAAQFLKRFVDDVPWAHLDVAGTAMSAPQTDINQSWASGYGVRLLDRLVADNYEK